MRWIFTIKHDISAKARLVIIGYQDPDLGELATASPTMSRRTRGLFLTMCSLHGWDALKGDVRAAFLQGMESEEERMIFSKPVRELAEALGGKEGDHVQIIKACYGLANAPSQWFNSVCQTMQECGRTPLQTEPCCWKLVGQRQDDKPTVGLGVAHVDDFLFGGDVNNDKWRRALDKIYSAYSWSPWEAESYKHCGVLVTQSSDGTFVLDHSEYCKTIEPIAIHNKQKREVTSSEVQQLRGALGALQWRPQHAARLSSLQSQLASPTIETLTETNKLIREVYNGRHIGLKYQNLAVDPKEVVFIGWSDAAVGNRRDWPSSGGYVIAATNKSMTEGRQTPLNVISWKAGKLPRIARSSL